MLTQSWPLRLRNFTLALGSMLIFTYLLLPLVTRSCGILNRMSIYLDANGIDPSRYYYTDVEQVIESERFITNALEKD
ncbi:MAG TPA: hypothetical protein PKB11_06280 [Desulfovibrio sp.]|jgi:hypothetical protein|uniref:hypothetical protein n=1 Tax=Desulfovibrio TaxID=872 RepID=UPI00041E9CE5|nr:MULTISPECIES: hypothetical protein [Desulfovibrio]MDY0306088.1 hypothetical protein [Desulfovibrionaceae bacterium]HMM38349.1 hypothetical protein [Desulfovibrio sp.]